ncbi:hypothetical protein SUGI_0426630 [Cryptomeria japonica]|nr:hypothetical protein SUGI_0426630 [Cryptomeria japonica]
MKCHDKWEDEQLLDGINEAFVDKNQTNPKSVDESDREEDIFYEVDDRFTHRGSDGCQWLHRHRQEDRVAISHDVCEKEGESDGFEIRLHPLPSWQFVEINLSSLNSHGFDSKVATFLQKSERCTICRKELRSWKSLLDQTMCHDKWEGTEHKYSGPKEHAHCFGTFKEDPKVAELISKTLERWQVSRIESTGGCSIFWSGPCFFGGFPVFASVKKRERKLAYFHQQLEDKYLEVSPRPKTPRPSPGNDSSYDSSSTNVVVVAYCLVAKAQAGPWNFWNISYYL